MPSPATWLLLFAAPLFGQSCTRAGPYSLHRMRTDCVLQFLRIPSALPVLTTLVSRELNRQRR